MVSSPGDLHRLFTGLVGGDLISAELFAEMTANESYGFGLVTDAFGMRNDLIGHDGSIIGYHSLALHSPETGRTMYVVAASDQVDLSPVVDVLADRIAAD